MNYVVYVSLVSFFLLFVTLMLSGRRAGPQLIMLFVSALVGAYAALRGYQILTEARVFLIYVAAAVVSRLIIYSRAFFVYKDPAANKLPSDHPVYKALYVVPVYNEQYFIARCVNSLVEAALYAHQQNIAYVDIVVVDDKSTNGTPAVLRGLVERLLPRLANVAGVTLTLLSLERNHGKKFALAAAMCGGENWPAGYDLFRKRYGRNPTADDYRSGLLNQCLAEAGCAPKLYDFIFHTDSDSTVSVRVIEFFVRAFASNPMIGAVSGHCDVWLDPHRKPTIWEKLQAARYPGAFALLKAALHPYVDCVSGPGAGFRAKAIMPHLLTWVYDQFGGSTYRGATDRMITYLILKSDWKVVYSQRARVWTVVPSTRRQMRSQMTRWKQNFFRMLGPWLGFSWRLPPVFAYMIYFRLLTTLVAPILVFVHTVYVLNGQWAIGAAYLIGIIGISSLDAIGTKARSKDEQVPYLVYRPLISLVSTLWGSVLTLRALLRVINRSFTWRDAGKEPFSVLGFQPNFEFWYWMLIVVVATIINRL